MAKFILREHLENKITDDLNNFILNYNNGNFKPQKTYPAILRPTKNASFGDFQINGVLALAKELRTNPRELAQQFADQYLVNDQVHFSKIEVAGPGFINLTLNNQWITELTENIYFLKDNLTVEKSENIVVDYSSPNIAKEMHVGHLRTTIIGDSIVRVLEFVGHNVIKANHIGDWGTQFGMLIAYMEEVEKDPNSDVNISDLDNFYRSAKARFDEDNNFQDYARSLVVKLQQGDQHYKNQWKKLIEITMSQNNETYRRLGVLLTDEDIMGESLYNPMLPQVVNEALEQNIATIDNGAVVAHLDEYKNKDGDKLGVILRKSDGGFLYATTDLAAMKYRVNHLGADRILYVTDSRQANHFAQIEIIARRLNFVPDYVQIAHVGFGMMLGKDGKPFKSRSGDVVRLGDLLDESVARTKALLESRGTEFDSDEQENELINTLAYGAIKYADLSKNRTTDYVFDWDNMISFEGNTAPYMQYSFTRIQSILRRFDEPEEKGIEITNNFERELALKQQEFAEVIEKVVNTYYPHLICTYLYELSAIFNSFYENVNVAKTEDKKLRDSRINLIRHTAYIIKLGLKLLGIGVVNKM